MRRLLEASKETLNRVNKQKLLMVTATVLTVTACTAGTTTDKAAAEPEQLNRETKSAHVVDVSDLGIPLVVPAELLQREQQKAQKLNNNAIRIEKAINLLRKTDGQTRYVFSGVTPGGWDCSGLVVWFYEQLGVTLEHRASLQAEFGREVDEPIFGDIVAFYHRGYKDAYHVAIYMGNGEFISAPRPGRVTTIEKLSRNQFIAGGGYMRYIRIIESKKYPST
jgi:cell wall-associated NlpC family hydrolase